MDNENLMNKETGTEDVVLSSNKFEGNFTDVSAIGEIYETGAASSDAFMEYAEEEDVGIDWDLESPEGQAGLEGVKDEIPSEVATERRVIGAGDSRKKVRQVGNIKKVPFRWICTFKVTFRDPDDTAKHREFEGGTGVLISPNHILTAAHVVYADIPGSRGTIKRQKALRIRAYIGRDGGTSSAIEISDSQSIAFLPAFKRDMDVRCDFAVIKLKEKVGLRKSKKLNGQVLGYWGSPKWGQNTHIKALTTDYLKTQIVNVGGYPKGKNGMQYLAYDKVKSAPPTAKGTPIKELITYLVDTGDGQSGAPVWKYIKSSGKRYLVAVHHGSCVASLDGCIKSGKVTSNLGVLITPAILKQIQSWKKTM